MSTTSNSSETSDSGFASTVAPRVQERRARTWVNWAVALLTAPGAALVMVLAIGGLVSTATCTNVTECPNTGPSGFVFGVVFYGAALVSTAVILASFLTAKRRWGIAVPAVGWALLVADLTAVTLIFR